MSLEAMDELFGMTDADHKKPLPSEPVERDIKSPAAHVNTTSLAPGSTY